ncbi:MAG: hypothetical protein IIV45_06845, partial [Lachnospiraceae bacterium]|nr:hypothetical protein [Lachnospiraceae bacterium]
MQRNILLKKRIGCLLAAALLAGEIGSASMVAVAAPVETTQTKVENQMENKPEVVDIPEEYITFGEPVVSEPDVKAEELDAAKAQSQENVQEKIPVIRPVEESETESLDVAKVAEGTKKEETQEELSMAFPESIPVLGNGISTTEEEKLDVVGNSEEGDSDQVNTIASISVNDVITGSGHNGVFETQYYLFTPEKSGYYGIYVPRRENCSVYMNVYSVENDNDYHYVYGSSFWDSDTYVYVSLEANKTYRISFDESYVGLEYSFDAKWIAIDDTEIAIGKNEVSVEKEHLVHLPSNNTLYKIKVQSEKGFDYELNGSGSSDGIVLKNGEENFFFYSGYSPLCLNKEVEVEDQVEITLEKVSASEYDLDNKFQEVNQYEIKMGNDTYVYSSYYSLIQ